MFDFQVTTWVYRLHCTLLIVNFKKMLSIYIVYVCKIINLPNLYLYNVPQMGMLIGPGMSLKSRTVSCLFEVKEHNFFTHNKFPKCKSPLTIQRFRNLIIVFLPVKQNFVYKVNNDKN